MKNRTTAAILALLLSELGIHWFYLGKSGRGVVYLLISVLLCWTIVAPILIFILGVIDFVRLLSMSDDEFNSIYNTGVPASMYQPYSSSQASAPQTNVNSNSSSTDNSKADSLFKLKSLLDSGILTQEEYEIQKRKILNS